MNLNKFNEIVKDIQSFADDEYEVISEPKTGEIVFNRNRETISIFVYEDENEMALVKCDGIEIPYIKYLKERLAQLDILATRLTQKYTKEFENKQDDFINPKSILYNEIDDTKEDYALETLEKEIGSQFYNGTKICFVTADAGHGKSMVLKEFQHKKATEYLNNESKYLFLHIDLHGRNLARLNEAIMFELGEMRIQGLYYQSIITLAKKKLIVFGIDGFDELAVEIGGEEALGSLSSFVKLLDGNGVLIAASRRTFFDTQNYIKQIGFRNRIGSGCLFNEMKIKNWDKEQCVQYLDKYTFNESDYDDLSNMLRPENPLLARPYLFTKLVNLSYDDNIPPKEFVKKSDNQLDTISGIIDAFIKREVAKFSPKDEISGKPHLTFDQHVTFLATVAEEMWDNKKDYISKEHLQLLLTILLQEWNIEEDVKHKVIRMVESHALLVSTNGIDRKFDHEEFKNYFLSIAFKNKVFDAIQTGKWDKVYRFLFNAQLPDTVADYFAKKLNNESKIEIVKGLLSIVKKEWKPTYIQPNIGTLIPYILDDVQIIEVVAINELIFSSLVFESKRLRNISFIDCTFTNISFRTTDFENIQFDNCTFSGLRIVGKNRFVGVNMCNCTINDLSYSDDGQEYVSEYSPIQIHKLLEEYGITSKDGFEKVEYYEPTEFYKTVKKFINKFSKTTWIYKKNIEESSRYISNNSKMVIDEIIPLLENYGIITAHTDSKTKQALTVSYGLNYEISEILKAEDDTRSKLNSFWIEVKKHS